VPALKEKENRMQAIFGSPGRYIQGTGAVDEVGACTALLGSRAVLIADPLVMAMAGDRIEASCGKAEVQLARVSFDEELTPALVARLVAASREAQPQVVIAAGGGRSIDAGKAVSHQLRCPVITLPTAASNDAPTSKNYVLYDENHRLLTVEHLSFSPAYVIVDTELIARAPASLLRAGIGDAISKKFEADQCGRAPEGMNMFRARPLAAARALAEACHDTLLRDAEAALAVAGTGKPTAAFERVVEAVILMSGLGFESGGLSIAHAMTRGLSVLRQVKRAPHGMQVAYGLLVQLELEARREEFLDEIDSFYIRTGLPRSLAALGLPDATAEELSEAAALTLAAPHARNFERMLGVPELVAAMRAVEQRAHCLSSTSKDIHEAQG
jgi:glycerol dehydrogenase